MRLLTFFVLAVALQAQTVAVKHRQVTASAPPASITRIQTATCHVEPSTSIVCTFGSPTTSGNTIIGIFTDLYKNDDSSARLPWAATDARSGCASPCNTSVDDYGPTSHTLASETGYIVRWSNITGGSSHAVTVTFTGGSTYVTGEVAEYSCGATHCTPDTSPVDAAGLPSGAGPYDWSTGSITTATANAMLLGFAAQGSPSSTFTMTSPATLVNTVSDGSYHEVATFNRTAATPGAYTVAGTASNGASIYTAIAAYKP